MFALSGAGERRTGVGWLLLVLSLGCGNRVIQLDVPDAALTGCQVVKRDDGFLCTVCFLADGTVVNRGSCEGPDAGNVSSPVPECKVVPREDLRCLDCFTGGKTYSSCLSCEAPVTTSSTGDSCRACTWNDIPDRRCLQCFTAGKLSSDDCNTLRSERLSGP
jgi:hypothetical protein